MYPLDVFINASPSLTLFIFKIEFGYFFYWNKGIWVKKIVFFYRTKYKLHAQTVKNKLILLFCSSEIKIVAFIFFVIRIDQLIWKYDNVKRFLWYTNSDKKARQYMHSKPMARCSEKACATIKSLVSYAMNVVWPSTLSILRTWVFWFPHSRPIYLCILIGEHIKQ